jgi:Ca-activated chloride channel homolog
LLPVPMRSLTAITLAGSILFAQNQQPPVFRTDVQMVVLAFTVTDEKGRSVSGLTASDVRILEDGIPQRIDELFEGARSVLRRNSESPPTSAANIFLLIDTSNRMYTLLPYVYDAVNDFVRYLGPADSVAIYTFSRNLFRAALLTNDHLLAQAELEDAVAGDDTALFNSILLTVRDAALTPGRKAVVVFSNGPDDVSMVAPDDVARVAENEGVPVYVISTQDPEKNPPMLRALRSLTARSGGKLYWAPRWQDQAGAFNSVREDIRSSYTAYYYPAPAAGPGFRHIQVEIISPAGKNWHVRARAGYEARRDGTGPAAARKPDTEPRP